MEHERGIRADLNELALRHLADYDARRVGAIFGEPGVELTLPEAYELQFKVASLREQRGEAVAGYKVGCVSEAVRRQLGLNEPVLGHLFASELNRSGASLETSRFTELAIEGEFALRIAEDIPDAAWLAVNAKRAAGGGFAVIELHHYAVRAPAGLRAQELVANNGMQAGVVLPGEEGSVLEPAGLLNETISVKRNGAVLGVANGSALPGGPLGSLTWLVERLGHFAKTLRRGQIVLTGSPLPLYRVAPGDRIEVKCERLTAVTLGLV